MALAYRDSCGRKRIIPSVAIAAAKTNTIAASG
jgi:hypothetical protein